MSNNPIPNLFIVGFPRSGTTSIHNYLNKHKEIKMSDIKEIGFFCDDFKESTYVSERWPCPKNIEEYLSFFEEGPERYIGESTPFYIFSKVAARNIYSFNSESKLLISIREPLDFLISLYQWNRMKSKSKRETFSEFINRDVKMKSDEEGNYESVLERTNYANYLKSYLNAFPKENIKIILYDNLKQNTEKEYEDILSFLELPSTHVRRFEIHNKGMSDLGLKTKALDENILKKLKNYSKETSNLLLDYGLINESLYKRWYG